MQFTFVTATKRAAAQEYRSGDSGYRLRLLDLAGRGGGVAFLLGLGLVPLALVNGGGGVAVAAGGFGAVFSWMTRRTWSSLVSISTFARPTPLWPRLIASARNEQAFWMPFE